MGSMTASVGAMGDGLADMITIMGGIDGLMGAFFGSLGDMIGVGGDTPA